ncbi:MAG: enoyl-CoA hydratase/isomerase family protein [Deltaproteobacteria bacterium]|nr:enoyl-CoA hydratase/isomerase family protein [Deltaproteobacteria bacterium]
MLERLTLEKAGDIATLFLDAPPQNRMDGVFFHELRTITRNVLPGLDTLGLVVRGRGRHFSSGADVEELLTTPQSDLPDNREALTALESLPYPVVAAIDGACFGSGLELALTCRARLATGNALLGLPEVTFDLMPGCGGTIRLGETVGLGPAIDMTLSGRFLDAKEARWIGLVDAVVPRKELDAAAARLVRALASDVTWKRNRVAR